MITVRDLMTDDPATVSPSNSLREVVELMKSKACRQLPVLDERGKLVGIITDRDVRMALDSPLVLHERWIEDLQMDRTKVESCMTRDPVTISPDAPAAEAAEILITKKFGAIPVEEDAILVGIITVTDFLRQVMRDHPRPIIQKRDKRSPSEIIVLDVMTANPITVSYDAPLTEAHNVLIMNNVRRLPVLDGKRFVGFITLADIKATQPSDAAGLSMWEINERIEDLTVEEVMNPCPFNATPTMTMGEAAQLMLEHNLAALPVMDREEFAGLITESDIFRRRIQAWGEES